MEFEKEYEKLKGKYSLPNYEELNKEIEILLVPEFIKIDFPLRFIRRRICEKLGWFMNTLEGFLQPNPSSVVSLEESNFFSESDKKRIIITLKEIVRIIRKSSILELENDEKEDAEFIIDVFDKKLPALKKELNYLLEVINKNWRKETEERGKDKYFG